jgi:aminopeptidase N
MLFRIAGFEIRYQLRSALFAIGFVIFLLIGFGFVASPNFRIEGSGNVLTNGPYGIIIRIAVLNLFGLFVCTAFMANVVIRDDETGLAPIIRATRITKLDYLLGRFLGAYVVSVLVMLSVPLGTLLGTAMPWLDPQRIGPTMLSYYGYGVAVFTMPSLFIFGAGLFALATVTRSMMWSYVGLLAALVGWFVASSLLSEPEYRTLAALVDPFGLEALDNVTRYWTAVERDTLIPPFNDLLLYNRLLWIAVGVALFALAYAIFRFDAKGSRAQRKAAPAATEELAPTTLTAVSPTAAPSSGVQLWALTRFEARHVLRSPAFFLLLAIGLLLVWLALQQTVEPLGDTDAFPVTRAVIGAALGVFVLFPIIIAVYYSGELVWRDRDQRIHEIIDSTRAPNWTFLIPKVSAIVLVLFASLLVAVVAGVLFQLFHGYTNIDPWAYLLWFLLPSFITAVMLAALAVVVQALVPHKFMGWAVMLLYLVAGNAFSALGLEHNFFLYGSTPNVPVSDFNGMDRFWVARTWFQAFWMLGALILLLAAHLLWRRGTEVELKPRIARLRQRLHGAPAGMLATAAVLMVGIGAFIFYNTNVLNEYTTQDGRDQWEADYEKALLAYENVPQPRIIDVKLDVELYPQQVRASTEGVYTIENRSGAPLSAVHVRWPQNLQLLKLEIDGARLGKEYPRFEYRIYELDTPMQPGEQRQIRFATLLEERGFPNEGPLTRIVSNGTFLNNFEITPLLGMDRNGVIRDRSKRRKYELPELRPAKLEDASANAYHYLRHDSDWVTAEISLTTDADQTPVAPGYTVSDTVQGQRRTLVTRTDAPIMHFFSLQSARYAVKPDRWIGPSGAAVDLAVYYYPEHEHNVQRMLDAMKLSLTMFSEKFSAFQFRQARILEFPAYARFAQSFANTIPYSEDIGFNQNYRDARSDETIDFVTYVTAHEIAHQWWAHQIIGADKQGMTLLSETFAQYSAYLVMEKLYGREQIRKFLKRELDVYLRTRGNEVVEELPLARVENQGHIHYQKGGLVMYWLKEVVGEDTVNRALQKLLQEFAFKSAPYPSSTDFLRLLRAEAGPQHEQLIADLFEKITLYDMKASGAKAKRLADGKYQVSFKVSAAKLYADGKGKETKVPLAEAFEVGAFSVEPGKEGYTSKAALFLERRSMQDGDQTVTLVVDQLPKYVGVDPYNKRIDRDSNNNLTAVTLE